MLWAIFSVLFFLAPSSLFFIMRRKFRDMDQDTKNRVVIRMSYSSLAIGFFTLMLEFFLSNDLNLLTKKMDDPGPNLDGWLNDPCPNLNLNLDGWREHIFQKSGHPIFMAVIMVMRFISFLVAWLMVVLQLLYKQNHDTAVGWEIFVSFFSSYVMLGGTSVELYHVIFCKLTLKMFVHSFISAVSSYGSLVSMHHELVSEVHRVTEVDRVHKRNLKTKDDEIKRLNLLINIGTLNIKLLNIQMIGLNIQKRRLNTQIKSLETNVSTYQIQEATAIGRIAELEEENKQKDDKIKRLICSSENQVVIAKQRDTEINRLRTKNEGLERITTQKDAEIKELNTRIAELGRSQVETTSQKNEEIHRLKIKNGELKSMARAYESKLLEKDEKIKELNTLIDVLDSIQVATTRQKDNKIHRLKTKNGELKSMARAYESKLLAKDEKIEELSGEAILMRVNLELNDDEEQLPAESGL